MLKKFDFPKKFIHEFGGFSILVLIHFHVHPFLTFCEVNVLIAGNHLLQLIQRL